MYVGRVDPSVSDFSLSLHVCHLGVVYVGLPFLTKWGRKKREINNRTEKNRGDMIQVKTEMKRKVGKEFLFNINK